MNICIHACMYVSTGSVLRPCVWEALSVPRHLALISARHFSLTFATPTRGRPRGNNWQALMDYPARRKQIEGPIDRFGVFSGTLMSDLEGNDIFFYLVTCLFIFISISNGKHFTGCMCISIAIHLPVCVSACVYVCLSIFSHSIYLSTQRSVIVQSTCLSIHSFTRTDTHDRYLSDNSQGTAPSAINISTRLRVEPVAQQNLAGTRQDTEVREKGKGARMGQGR